MPACKLTNKANSDLDNIWDYTYDFWGENQADKYYYEILNACQFLAENPFLGKNYPEIQPDIFGYRINKHILFFQKIALDDILIVRILHSEMDLKSRIKE